MSRYREKLKPEDTSAYKRLQAYYVSTLPNDFRKKMLLIFDGKACPICYNVMRYKGDYDSPSINHNIPISKDGKHEINNISIICKRCNMKTHTNIIENSNTKEVKEVWDIIKDMNPIRIKRLPNSIWKSIEVIQNG